MKPEYVVVLAFPILKNPLVDLDAWKLASGNTSVLLVEKDKPEWQKGRFNLPGGKIEEGESPEQAALREIFEEAGPIVTSSAMPVLMGSIQGSWGKVYCLRVFADPSLPLTPQESETQKIFWGDWASIKDDPRLIPNLRVIIPMMMMGVKDWNIFDEGPSWGKDTHVIDIEVKNGWPKEEK